MAWVDINSFQYGETSSRLNGIKNSKVFKASGKTLTNVGINNLGGLTATKEYETTQVIDSEIFKVIETSFDWYIVMTYTHFQIIDKVTNKQIKSISHNSISPKDYTILDKTQLIITGLSIDTYELDSIAKTITHNDYFADMQMPIQHQENVLMDLWQKDTVGTDKRITKLQTITNPKLTVSHDGKTIKLANSSIQIVRLYTNYKAVIDYTDTSTADKEVFAVLHNGLRDQFPVVKTSYTVGNTLVTIGTPGAPATPDNLGDYYTTITPLQSIGDQTGIFTYGQIIDLSVFELVTSFQNRLAITKDNKIYFSKTFEYDNFRNPSIPTYANEPFYMEPAQIDNAVGNIVSLLSDDTLWIVTDRGVYVSGYNLTVSGTNLGRPTLASNIEATSNSVLINKDLYYLTPKGRIKSIQRNYTNSVLSYAVSDVCKFDSNDKYYHIGRHVVDDVEYCIASRVDLGANYLYLFEPLNDVGQFRRTTYEMDILSFHSEGEILINDKTITLRGNNNVQFMKIEITTPEIKTSKGGSYLNDAHSLLSQTVVKLLNQDKAAVKYVTINGKLVNNLGMIQDDIYSVYYIKGNKKIGATITIQIETNQNNEILEVQGIELQIEPKGV